MIADRGGPDLVAAVIRRTKAFHYHEIQPASADRRSTVILPKIMAAAQPVLCGDHPGHIRQKPAEGQRNPILINNVRIVFVSSDISGEKAATIFIGGDLRAEMVGRWL